MKGRFTLKEYIVCYTLDHDIKRVKILKDQEVKKEEIKQEVLDKVLQHSYIVANCEQGDYRINSSSIRYIRVL